MKKYYRIGAICGILGSLLTAAIINIHPRESTSGVHFTLHHLEEIARTQNWRLLHLIIVVSAPMLLAGLLLIAHRLYKAGAGGMAVMAGAMAVAGTALGMTTLAIDGFAMKLIADSFVVVHPTVDSASYFAFKGFESIQLALFSMVTFNFYGIMPILFGMATLSSRLYKPWFGWIAIVAGLVGVVVGSYQLMYAVSLMSILGFVAASTVTNLWVAGMCAAILRPGKDQ